MDSLVLMSLAWFGVGVGVGVGGTLAAFLVMARYVDETAPMEIPR